MEGATEKGKVDIILQMYRHAYMYIYMYSV